MRSAPQSACGSVTACLASAAPAAGALRANMKANTTIAYDYRIEGDLVVTRLDAAINWFRKNSLWPMPMGLACCAI